MSGSGRLDQGEPLVHPLSFVRAERNWTYQDLVNVVARRVGNMSARREKAWRWEHRGVVPDRETQLALADELGVPDALVHTLGWPAWLPVGERVNVQVPWTWKGCLTALRATAGAALLDRRGFMVTAPGAAAAAAEQWLALERESLPAVAPGGRLNPVAVECLDRRLPSIRQIEAALGGGSVRGAVDAELHLATDLLTKGSRPMALGQRLFAIAGELGRIAGWASFDAGYLAAAERYFMVALRAAHAAGDRAMGANILKCFSLQLMEGGRPNEALVLARAAREGARHAPPRVVAMLTVRQARAHARLGQAAECERLLAAAETAMARADEEPAPGWADDFDEAEYCAQVAACYLGLRRHVVADHRLRRALTLQPARRDRDRATYLMWQAETALRLGEVDRACDLTGEAVRSISGAESVRNRRHLAALHRQLREHRGVAAVRELDDRIRPLIA